MTELNRPQARSGSQPDDRAVENDREQTVDFDTNVFTKKEFQESPVTANGRLIQSHLRAGSLKSRAAIASSIFKHAPNAEPHHCLPAGVADYRNIKLEQLLCLASRTRRHG